MSDATLFILIFGGLFLLRAIAATFVYAWLLSDAPECPNCSGETLHLQRRGLDRLFPRLQSRWCPECGWDGLLHPQAGTRTAGQWAETRAKTESQPGQLPLISQKSLK